jgi:hypothetical protein
MFFYFKDQKFLHFLGVRTKFLAQNKQLRRSLERPMLSAIFPCPPLHVNLNFPHLLGVATRPRILFSVKFCQS